MEWLAWLAVAVALGYAVGRRWVVGIPPAALLVAVTAASLVDNIGTCTRPDGCGPGPVAQAVLLALIGAAVLAAATFAGVWLRRR